jgi:hypothetical protein
MPSSKRNKLGKHVALLLSARVNTVSAAMSLCRGRHSLWLAVTLSKVKKKTKEWKGGLIVTAHKLLEE